MAYYDPRETLAVTIGNSFKEFSDKLWNTASDKFLEPDWFWGGIIGSPIRDALRGTLGKVRDAFGGIAYSIGKAVGYAIYDSFNKKIVDTDTALKKLIGDAETRLKTLMANWETKLSEASKRLDDTIISYTSKFAGLDTDILNLESWGSSLDSSLRALNLQLTDFNSRVNYVNSALSSFETKIINYDSRFGGLDTKILDTENYVTRVRDWANDLIAKLETRVLSLESGVVSTQKDYQGLSGILEQIKDKLGI